VDFELQPVERQILPRTLRRDRIGLKQQGVLHPIGELRTEQLDILPARESLVEESNAREHVASVTSPEDGIDPLRLITPQTEWRVADSEAVRQGRYDQRSKESRVARFGDDDSADIVSSIAGGHCHTLRDVSLGVRIVRAHP